MKSRGKAGFAAALLCAALLGQTVEAAVNNGETYAVATDKTKGWPKGPNVYSETAVLMDADTGEILYDKGKDETRYPASITKVMTTLLALEETEDLDQEVTFTESGLERMAEGTNLNMKVGEVLTMEECLYAVMIKSANEVAAQVAEEVGGTQKKFVEMMNERAEELGCTNTNFTNPSGLPDENHWTTAADMALILQEALKNEDFVEIIGTMEYTIPATNKTEESRTLTSHHALMVESAPEYYEGCIGGKTGVTEAAKNTLATAAKRDGVTLIAVVMRADPGQVCADTIALFDYGFDKFKPMEMDGLQMLVPQGAKKSDIKTTSKTTDEGEVTTYTFHKRPVGEQTVPVQEEEEEEALEEELMEREQEKITEAQLQEQQKKEKSEHIQKERRDLKRSYHKIVAAEMILALAGVLACAAKSFSNQNRARRRRNRKKR